VTDAHCHVADGESRCFLCSPFALPAPEGSLFFLGAHPWCLDGFNEVRLRMALERDSSIGVGEIGLDRLRDRTISPRMREIFERQLEIASEFGRPVVLHGAKCWGEVVKACLPYAGRIPAFLFHGFSRSEGLLQEIAAMNGFVSIGPALLNDHAVNYHRMASKIPIECLLIESDRTPENTATVPCVLDIASRLASIRKIPLDELVGRLEANATRFVASLMPFTIDRKCDIIGGKIEEDTE